MAEQSTFELIATHVALATRPLREAVSDAESFQRFMYGLGWKVDDLPPAWSALGARVDAILTAVEGLGDSPRPEDIADLLEHLKGLLEAIRAISDAPSGVPAGEFLSDVGERLFETLLVDYLTEAFPLVSTTLEMLDVIVRTGTEPTSTRPAFVETRFRFAEIPRVIADPLSIPARVYGWGTPDLEFELIAGHLQELLLALDFPAATRQPSAPRGVGYQAARHTTVKAIDIELVVPLLEIDVAGEIVDVGLALVELPGEEGKLPGLILEPMVPPAIATEVQVRPDLALTFRAGSDIAQTFGIFVRPGELGVRYPFQPGTVPPSAGFGAQLSYRPDTPSLLLGSHAASRLELAGVTSQLALDFVGSDADLQLELALEGLTLVLALGDQDSFIGSLLSGRDLTIALPLGIRWSNRRGFNFTGGAGFEVTVAPHRAFGPITLDTVHLALLARVASDAPPSLTAGASVGLHGALGPIAFTVEGIGVTLEATFANGNAGPFSLEAGFKPPNGLGLVVDTGLVTGGGFLSLDRDAGRYAGILQLRVADIGITAIGILDTRLPGGTAGYSLLILVSATFPPIQLGYGFTLNGVGGLAGVHRTMVVEALQAGMRDHSIDRILFPEDPVANATQIISDLRTFFPPVQGRFVFGPMALIGWGTPPVLHIELGILLELPAPIRLVLLGQLSVMLPTEEAPLIELHVDILGVLDMEAKRISVDAILYDSRLAAFTLTGSMAFRLSWGEDPVLVLAIGGLNPHFQPPPGFPTLQPITVSLGLDQNPRISLRGYLARTANTMQAGALAELYAEAGGFNIYGWIGFDALFVFAPFSFVTDFSGGVKLSRGSRRLAGVQLNATLSGISPWRAKGRACVSLWLFDVCVPFDKRFGSEKRVEPPRVNPEPLLLEAIGDARNWSATVPPASWRAVSVVTPAAGEDQVLLDPVGGVELRQRVLPLNRRITRFGEATPEGPGQYDVTEVRLGGRVAEWSPVQDHFAPAQFEELTDAQKLSLPSFARMDAGVSVAAESLTAGPGLGTDVVYETRIVDRPWGGRRGLPYPLPERHQLTMIAAGAAARSPFRSLGAEKFSPAGLRGTPVSLGEEPYVVAGVTDLEARSDLGGALSKSAAYSALARHLERHPEDRGTLQVVPSSEAVSVG